MRTLTSTRFKNLRTPAFTILLAVLCSFGFVSETGAIGTIAVTNPNQNQATVLANVIRRGDNEINRRLTALNSLSGVLASAKHVSSSDLQTLLGEVTTETANLTALKSKLDSETTLSAARNDDQSVINEYRVYVLVFPKVMLVKVADDQQTRASLLSQLETKLATRLQGGSTSTQQAQLSDMSSHISAATKTSTTIQAAVIGLQPSDYNANHSILSGDLSELKTAQSNLQTASTDAQSIISSLKD